MNTRRSFLMMAATVALTGALAATAQADEVKMVGVITKIKLAPDGKSAVAILKDNKSGDKVTLQITDDLTLDKFKDHRIVEGDEIRAKYQKDGENNLSKSFLKTAGC